MDNSQPNKSLAQRWFNADRELEKVQDEFMNACQSIIGALPFDDIKCDPHDNSFELLDANNDLTLTDDQWARFVALGFDCAWIVHVDGSEHIYPGNHFRAKR